MNSIPGLEEDLGRDARTGKPILKGGYDRTDGLDIKKDMEVRCWVLSLERVFTQNFSYSTKNLVALLIPYKMAQKPDQKLHFKERYAPLKLVMRRRQADSRYVCRLSLSHVQL